MREYTIFWNPDKAEQEISDIANELAEIRYRSSQRQIEQSDRIRKNVCVFLDEDLLESYRMENIRAIKAELEKDDIWNVRHNYLARQTERAIKYAALYALAESWDKNRLENPETPISHANLERGIEEARKDLCHYDRIMKKWLSAEDMEQPKDYSIYREKIVSYLKSMGGKATRSDLIHKFRWAPRRLTDTLNELIECDMITMGVEPSPHGSNVTVYKLLEESNSEE